MKTNTTNSRCIGLVSLAIAVTAALVTTPANAGVIDTLVITENSSTSLTALLNGTTTLNVLNTSSDNWTIDLAGVSAPVASRQFWAEPEAFFANQVGFFGVPNQLGVTSDVFEPFTTKLADGTADTTTFTLNGSPLFVTFFDKGDVAAAPDTGSTLGLLFGSLLALFGFGRLRAWRSA